MGILYVISSVLTKYAIQIASSCSIGKQKTEDFKGYGPWRIIYFSYDQTSARLSSRSQNWDSQGKLSSHSRSRLSIFLWELSFSTLKIFLILILGSQLKTLEYQRNHSPVVERSSYKAKCSFAFYQPPSNQSNRLSKSLSFFSHNQSWQFIIVVCLVVK